MTAEPNSPWPTPGGSPVIVESAAPAGHHDDSHNDTPTDMQLTPRTRQGRVFTGIAVVALLAGSGLAYAGATGQVDSDEVVLEVESASAPISSTVAPLVTEPSTTSVPTPAPGSTAPTTTELPLSPLADLLGDRYSVVPEKVEPRPRPVVMEIDAFDVSQFPIRAVGLEDDGQLEVPDETEIGWYQYGATSGRPGATVLAAHVSWNRAVGPFGQLGNLEPGNLVSVTLDDGTKREYEVFERAIYGKLELPRERIWRNTGPETLVLITCGGDFNPEIRRYRENIVVYAAPVG
jgi:hypothetical protein